MNCIISRGVYMSSCTFFGHYHLSREIKPKLKETIRKLIVEYNVTDFYLGDKGAFDSMATECVIELSEEYPHIKYSIMLAYMPGKKDPFAKYPENTVYPEGLEKVPPKFAIIGRNKIMAEKSDYAIVYIYHFGGAANAAEYADKKGVKIINISNEDGRKYFEYNNSFSV